MLWAGGPLFKLDLVGSSTRCKVAWCGVYKVRGTSPSRGCVAADRRRSAVGEHHEDRHLARYSVETVRRVVVIVGDPAMDSV